jgi:hypothetical protein
MKWPAEDRIQLTILPQSNSFSVQHHTSITILCRGAFFAARSLEILLALESLLAA